MPKTKAVAVVKEETSLDNEAWYQALVEECQAIKVERTFNAASELVAGKWELGQRISQANEHMDRKKSYGQRIIEKLSIDMKHSTADLHSCVQFYHLYEADNFDLAREQLPSEFQGKNLSWMRVRQELLPAASGKVKEEKIKQSYKLNDICEVFKAWAIAHMGLRDEVDIENTVNEFRQQLINEKGLKVAPNEN